jgi:hypothetical protein
VCCERWADSCQAGEDVCRRMYGASRGKILSAVVCRVHCQWCK